MFLKFDPYMVWSSIFYSKLVECILLRSLCSTVVLWKVGRHSVAGKESKIFPHKSSCFYRIKAWQGNRAQLIPLYSKWQIPFWIYIFFIVIDETDHFDIWLKKSMYIKSSKDVQDGIVFQDDIILFIFWQCNRYQAILSCCIDI
jgi:hypothetical protein